MVVKTVKMKIRIIIIIIKSITLIIIIINKSTGSMRRFRGAILGQNGLRVD